jgi:hypothetical protein
MTRKLFILLILLIAGVTSSKVMAEDSNLVIGYREPSSSVLPSNAQELLKQKIVQLIAINGLGSTDACARFAVMPQVTVESSDVTSSAPPKQIVKLSVILFLVDNTEEKAVFNQVQVTSKGVGKTTEEAYINAIKSINVRYSGLKSFMTTGKKKILDYYEKSCNQSIEKAIIAAKSGNCEMAYGILRSVPGVCEDCYEKAAGALSEISEYCEQSYSSDPVVTSWCQPEVKKSEVQISVAKQPDIIGQWELIRINSNTNLSVREKLVLNFNTNGNGLYQKYGEDINMSWKVKNNELKLKIGNEAEKSIPYAITEHGELVLENFRGYSTYTFKRNL